MNGKKWLRRMAALFLAALLAGPACLTAGSAEGKTPGMYTHPLNPEIVIPSTWPLGYEINTDHYGVYLRDANDTMIDGEWQTKRERPVALSVERISGDIPEEETDGLFQIVETEDGGKDLELRRESLKTPGTASFIIHIVTEHYYLDYEYTLRARAFDEAKDALATGRMKMSITTADDPLDVLYEYFREKELTVGGWDTTFSPGIYEYQLRLGNIEKGFRSVFPVTLYVSEDGAWKGSGTVETVASYAELLRAVTEKNADEIRISPKYKHGKNELDEPLEVDWGRTVTISPAEGQDSAVINGRIEIRGNGHVVFDRVDIEAPQGETGLRVTDGADVTIGSVKGGDSGKENGGTAVFVRDARLTVTSARGGNSATGLAGDGVVAVGEAEVTVTEAAGGSSDQGVGGAGVIAVSGARVTVNGSATGGNGASAPGRGTLTGEGSTVTTAGEARDGETVEAKKKADPEIINSYAMLQNAIRNGKTEIVLDATFAFGQAAKPLPLFSLGGETVRITGPEGKTLKIKDGLFDFSCGKWEVSGISLNSKSAFTALSCSGEGTEVVWNGDLSVSNGNAVVVTDHGNLTLNGNVDHSSKNAVAVGAIEGGRIRITGNVTEKADTNAVYADDAEIVLTGNISKAGTEAPAVYASGSGAVMINGDLSASKCQAVRVNLGFVRLNGNLSGKPQKYPLLYAGQSGTVEINGAVPAGMRWEGTVFVNGEKPE